MYPNIVVTFELINGIFRFAPIVADAEAGFGGALNCFELMKVRLQYSNLKILAILKLLQAYIEAGAAGVHFEGKNITYRPLYKPVFVHALDQLGSEKKCGHMGFYFCLLFFHAFMQFLLYTHSFTH